MGTKFRDGAEVPEVSSAVGREKDRQAVLMKKYLWGAWYYGGIGIRIYRWRKKIGEKKRKNERCSHYFCGCYYNHALDGTDNECCICGSSCKGESKSFGTA